MVQPVRVSPLPGVSFDLSWTLQHLGLIVKVVDDLRREIPQRLVGPSRVVVLPFKLSAHSRIITNVVIQRIWMWRVIYCVHSHNLSP